LNILKSQMQALISALGNMDQESKNAFARQLFVSRIYQKKSNDGKSHPQNKSSRSRRKAP
jgi:hypothetical protein